MRRTTQIRCWLLALMLVLGTGCTGCTGAVPGMNRTWHQKCGWVAEDYFEDPQVRALCKAIEANDLAEIDRLVAAGANVNAKGKGNMTPLLWALPDNNLPRFKRLLEHGADPNVIIESEFNTHGGMRAGDSVTHMVCKSNFPGYFEAVFEHGGDVNLVNGGKGNITETPIFKVILFATDKETKLRMLIDKGTNLNYVSGNGKTPAQQATTWGGQYDISLMLLKAGADHTVYIPRNNTRLIHLMVMEKNRRGAHWPPQQQADYERLLKWLEDRGESFAQAEADLNRWKSWSITTGEYRRNLDAEIAERERLEAQAKKAPKNAPAEKPKEGK